MNKRICSVLLALTGLLPVCSAQLQELVYGTDARDSSGRPVRILEQIREDGSGQKQLISPDFKGENFWPGYRGFGPNQYEYSDVSVQGNIIFTNTYNFFVLVPGGKTIYNLTRFIREKYQPRWSPDGKRIAFVTDLNNNCEIFLMNVDGTGMKNISWNRASHFSPSWSPDGKQLSFISNRDGKFELYISDDQGIRQKKILSLPEDIREPDWGRNNRIAFSVVKADGSTDVMSVRPDGTDLKKHFSTPVWSGHVSWSNDGRKIAYSSQRSGNADIWVFDTGTNEHFNVTKTPYKQDYFPRWVNTSSVVYSPWKADTQVIADSKLTMDGRIGKKPLLSMPIVIPPVKLERPRMLFTAKDLPAIRARFAKAPYKTYWERFLKKCDGFLTDPKVEVSLKKIATDPMRKRYAIPAFAELYYRELWLDAMMSLAFARQITGDDKYGKRAVEIMLKAAEEYRYAYGVMHSDYRMACAYDWVYDLIPKKDLKSLNVLLKVSLDAKKDTCLNHQCGIYGSAPGGGNYAIYFAASLGPMGFAMMGEEGISDDYRLVAERLSLLTLNKWLGEHGDAEEGFSYFHHPVGELTPFLVTLKKHNQAQALLDSNLKKIPGWMAVSAMKGGTETPAIDDADYLALRLPTGLLELYPEDQNLRKLWNSVPRKASELNSVLGLLWWQPSEGKPQDWGKNGLPDHGYFPHQGYAVLRTGDKMEDSVMAITAPQGSGHAHLTYGAISLTSRGLRFLTEPGQAVPMSEYHSQIIIDGEGRNRSALSKPMLKKPVRDGNTVSVAVDFTEAFAVSFFGAPGYSGIPCGRAGIKSGKRIVTMMKAADGIPAYYLVYDKVEAGRNVKVEQLFTADQGMAVWTAASSRHHWMEINDGLFKGYYQSSEKADKAEWTVKVPKKGKWYFHLYARNGAPVSLEIDGKKYAVTYLQPYSRPDTWQWRHFRMKNKPFFVELGAGEHKIAIQSQAKIYAIALSERSDIYLGADAKTDLLLEVADAKRIGKGWKWIKQEQTELHLIPMIGKPEIQVTRKIFNTRFHGQLQVALPQGIFSQKGEKVEFLTLVYPAAPGMEIPVVKDGKIYWKKAVDTVEPGNDFIKIRRTLK
ncbi:MAG: PD40 domain-containing protein [Lentisphaeria bacterium]|nr:PD40 domain-containing protein [Lentisphaeria bacterium]